MVKSFFVLIFISHILCTTQLPALSEGFWASAPEYVTVPVVLSKEKHSYIVLDEILLYEYLASTHKLKIGLKARRGDLQHYQTAYFVSDRESVKRGTLVLDLASLVEFCALDRFKDQDQAADYLKKFLFDTPFSLVDIGVSDTAELESKLFTQTGQSTFILSPQNHHLDQDPRFIGMLLDLGYRVGKGDIAPVLWICK
jgi:hypothetical protein